MILHKKLLISKNSRFAPYLEADGRMVLFNSLIHA